MLCFSRTIIVSVIFVGWVEPWPFQYRVQYGSKYIALGETERVHSLLQGRPVLLKEKPARQKMNFCRLA